ncbi:MAG TPA: alpha/beta hydrolase, partial [Polyangiaceae bacterium]|nr:alpha/beta hydrolase [Polyangiaceae bacterium]
QMLQPMSSVATSSPALPACGALGGDVPYSMASVSPGLPLEHAEDTRRSLFVRRPLRVRATKHPQHDATVLGGVRLRYVDVRSATEQGPPLVMLHGIASRIEEYEDIIDRQRGGRRIIVMDLPGNGYSDKPERPYTLGFLEDSVLGLLDSLQVKEADLAGGSLGGHLVLRLGHRAPGRFRRLVPWAPAGAWKPMRALSLLLKPWLSALFWPFVWVQSRFWYHPKWLGRRSALLEAFAHYREIHTPGFVRMYFDIAREQVETSLFPIAPSIAQPTLVLWGDQDHALGMGEGVRRLVSLLPDARLRVLPGVRHALANEAPDELAREVDAFLYCATTSIGQK